MAGRNRERKRVGGGWARYQSASAASASFGEALALRGHPCAVYLYHPRHDAAEPKTAATESSVVHKKGFAKRKWPKNTRTPNPRYLIVCEGTKMEPRYFAELLTDPYIRLQRVFMHPTRACRRIV